MSTPNTIHKKPLDALRNERGAFDLASIMVGLIILGIAVGIIAATVFLVIPWSQDRAAKAQLRAVETSENTYSGMAVDYQASSADDPAPTGTNYADLSALVGSKLLSVEMKEGSDTTTSDGRICVIADGDSWRAWSASATGNVFYATSSQSGVLGEGDAGYILVDPNLCSGFQQKGGPVL